MSLSTGVLSLTDFTAFELPIKKWMRLVRPKMRLRVRVQNHDFVSPAIKLNDRSLDGTNMGSSVRWPWLNDDERFSRPSFDDDEEFEIEIERRFLLRYKCIRRTQPTTINQIRTGDHCALPLYDGQRPRETLEGEIRVGDITFALRNDASSEGKATASTYS